VLPHFIPKTRETFFARATKTPRFRNFTKNSSANPIPIKHTNFFTPLIKVKILSETDFSYRLILKSKARAQNEHGLLLF
jgi:hypothetical protein